MRSVILAPDQHRRLEEIARETAEAAQRKKGTLASRLLEKRGASAAPAPLGAIPASAPPAEGTPSFDPLLGSGGGPSPAAKTESAVSPAEGHEPEPANLFQQPNRPWAANETLHVEDEPAPLAPPTPASIPLQASIAAAQSATPSEPSLESRERAPPTELPWIEERIEAAPMGPASVELPQAETKAEAPLPFPEVAKAEPKQEAIPPRPEVVVGTKPEAQASGPPAPLVPTPAPEHVAPGLRGFETPAAAPAMAAEEKPGFFARRRAKLAVKAAAKSSTAARKAAAATAPVTARPAARLEGPPGQIRRVPPVAAAPSAVSNPFLAPLLAARENGRPASAPQIGRPAAVWHTPEAPAAGAAVHPINVKSLGDLRVSLFKQHVGSSDFAVDDVQLMVDDEDRLHIALGVHNADPKVSHSAVIKVSLKGAAGESLCGAQLATGLVAPNRSTALTFEFAQPHLLSRYGQHLVSINQTA